MVTAEGTRRFGRLSANQNFFSIAGLSATLLKQQSLPKIACFEICFAENNCFRVIIKVARILSISQHTRPLIRVEN